MKPPPKPKQKDRADLGYAAGAFGGFGGLPAFSALTLAHLARCASAIHWRTAADV
jgi:hypothetical protein